MSACVERAGHVRFRRQLHRAAWRLRPRIGQWASTLPAAGLLLLSLPVLLPALLCARIRKERRVGRLAAPFMEYTLVNRTGKPLPVIGNWPHLWNVVRGQVALVGPEARGGEALDLKAEQNRRIASVSPGLVSNWWIRQRTNIAYTTQSVADLEYVESRSFRTDAGIALRALISLAYGRQGSEFAAVPEILGLPLDNVTLDEAVTEVLRPAAEVRQISFINVDCVNKSCGDSEYRQVLQQSSLRLADGIGLRIAGKILRSEIRQNVNGTDLFPVLCERMERDGLKLFLLGGRPGVADDVARWVRSRYPNLSVAGTCDGYAQAVDEEAVTARINQAGADVLLVAMGAPGQEKWIARNRGALRVRSALGVGGLFDFYSGRIPRAPQWLREMGLEWTWRLCQEPGRMWRRYLVGNVVFLVRVFWSKVTRPADGRRAKEPECV